MEDDLQWGGVHGLQAWAGDGDLWALGKGAHYFSAPSFPKGGTTEQLCEIIQGLKVWETHLFGQESSKVKALRGEGWIQHCQEPVPGASQVVLG